MIGPEHGQQLDDSGGSRDACGADCALPQERPASARQTVVPQLLVDHPALANGSARPEPPPAAPAAESFAPAIPEPFVPAIPEPFAPAIPEPMPPTVPEPAEQESAGEEPGIRRSKAPARITLIAGLLVVVLALALLGVLDPAPEEEAAGGVQPAAAPSLAELPGEWRLTVYVTETGSGRRMTMVNEGRIALKDLQGGLYFEMVVTEASRSDSLDMSGYVGQPLAMAGYYHEGVLSFAYPGFPALYDARPDEEGVFSDSRMVRANEQDIRIQCELLRLDGEGGGP